MVVAVPLAMTSPVPARAIANVCHDSFPDTDAAAELDPEADPELVSASG